MASRSCVEQLPAAKRTGATVRRSVRADQVGRHAEARESYQAALKLKPDEITVIDNIGLSYALQGDLGTAEAELGAPSALPGGRENGKVRQNLALVMGLQGRFDEARNIASHDLPRAQVEADLASLEEMTSQPNPSGAAQGAARSRGRGCGEPAVVLARVPYPTVVSFISCDVWHNASDQHEL